MAYRKSIATLVKDAGLGDDCFGVSRLAKLEPAGGAKPLDLSASTLSPRNIGRLTDALFQMAFMMSAGGLSADEAADELLARSMKGARALSRTEGEALDKARALCGGDPAIIAADLRKRFNFVWDEGIGCATSPTSMSALAKLLWFSKFGNALDVYLAREDAGLTALNVDEPTTAIVSDALDATFATVSGFGELRGRRYARLYPKDAPSLAASYGWSALTSDAMWFFRYARSYPDSRTVNAAVANYLLARMDGFDGDNAVNRLALYNPIIATLHVLDVGELDEPSVRRLLGVLGVPERDADALCSTSDLVDEKPAKEDPPKDKPEQKEKRRRRRRRTKATEEDGLTPTERRRELFGDERITLSEMIENCVPQPRGGVVPELARKSIEFPELAREFPRPASVDFQTMPRATHRRLVDAATRIELAKRLDNLSLDDAFNQSLLGASVLDSVGVDLRFYGFDVRSAREACRRAIDEAARGDDVSASALSKLYWLSYFARGDVSRARPLPAEPTKSVEDDIRALAQRAAAMISRYGTVVGFDRDLAAPLDMPNVRAARSDFETDNSVVSLSVSQRAPSSKGWLAAAARLSYARASDPRFSRSALVCAASCVSHHLTARSVAGGTALAAIINDFS